ncbi:MAG: hypothetical protein LBT08_07675, partial [Synergistaceae bacterium]|nr:hypothetical protein [Synergistaceae bacterium]
AMAAYLEVRADDHRGGIILDAMREEWEIINRTLNPKEIEVMLSFRHHTLNTLFGIPLTSPVSYGGMLGMGKLTVSGGNVLVCDTYGDKLWVFARNGERQVLSGEAARPVVAVPFAPADALLFLKSGDLLRIKIDAVSGTIGSTLEGSIAANVADAAVVDSTLMAVADRTGQSVRFYGIPSLGETAEWRPDDSDDTEKLFEPVALATWGPFLAIADRGNGRVYILDSYTLSVQNRFEIDLPRDLDWGNNGELYVLSENGTLYMRFPAGGASTDLKVVARGMKEAWSFAWSGMGPVVADVAGKSWWSSSVSPGNRNTLGAIALHDPWIEDRNGAETLMLRGAASSLYHNFIQNKAPDTSVVWRSEVRPSRVIEVGASNKGSALFYSPSSGVSTSTREITQANSLDDVMNDIAARSRAGGDMPKVVVLDTRISVPDESLAVFLSFLIHQGVRLDLWAIGRPAPAPLESVSKITLGYTYYSRVLETVPFNNSIEWILSLPLPPETSTFGYPSEATLTVLSNIDMIRFTDWLPIWPSLLDKRRP